jgi:hypothetical protein
MLHEDRRLLCERVGAPSKFHGPSSRHLGRPCARVRERCSFPPMPCPFGGILCSFLRMLCLFVGHPHADSAMPSSFSEPRDPLAAFPWGLREAHRVLGAAPPAYARTAMPLSTRLMAPPGALSKQRTEHPLSRNARACTSIATPLSTAPIASARSIAPTTS